MSVRAPAGGETQDRRFTPFSSHRRLAVVGSVVVEFSAGCLSAASVTPFPASHLLLTSWKETSTFHLTEGYRLVHCTFASSQFRSAKMSAPVTQTDKRVVPCLSLSSKLMRSPIRTNSVTNPSGLLPAEQET
ncbi:hypothetical protein N657DRAFT_263775 [Parathielavia appendiculata]|uniref:Uncharacterized protein n=1 Tax=Parathielavia appendiculata TaxID=2587402 RepID=A0AAN6TS46_9PEZI|nr:hypothetical protein N657DRAFT_263775 [Parathielavia appendiculata]